MRNRKKYPPQWQAIARECKIAANWCCSQCGIKHGTRRVSQWTGKEWPVWLQAAHVKHDQANEQPELICVCPACHWRYYRKPGQRLTNGQVEQRKHRILLERSGYHGPWQSTK